MIHQGNDHKTHHCDTAPSAVADLLLLPRPRRGTRIMQRMRWGCTQSPSHGPSYIQPNNPKRALSERLGKRKSPQLGRVWEHYSHARATAVWCLNSFSPVSWRNPTATHKQLAGHKAFRGKDSPAGHLSDEPGGASCLPQQHLPGPRLARSNH